MTDPKPGQRARLTIAERGPLRRYTLDTALRDFLAATPVDRTHWWSWHYDTYRPRHRTTG